jgi:excisionase family DNA binding protein
MKRLPLTAPPNGALLLDVPAVAVLLGCTARAVRAYIARNDLPFQRLGSRIVFRREKLEQWLDALPGVSVDEATENIARRTNGTVRR